VLTGPFTSLFAACFSSALFGQAITDGDTLKQGGITYRLWGIDAPEAKQVCPDGWPAGSFATTRLQTLTAGRTIVCQEKDRDRYGRIVAVCRASGEGLGAILVREGLAWAFVRYSGDYVSQEAKAKADRIGAHAHGCQPAWEWRAQQSPKTGHSSEKHKIWHRPLGRQEVMDAEIDDVIALMNKGTWASLIGTRRYAKTSRIGCSGQTPSGRR
jgi:hypothetical protein